VEIKELSAAVRYVSIKFQIPFVPQVRNHSEVQTQFVTGEQCDPYSRKAIGR
jgi:hypothetical protein